MDKNSIRLREDFYRKLNEETENSWKKLAVLVNQHYPKGKRRIPIPINMNLYGEYLVMQKLLELGLQAVHNKEDEWPEGIRRDSADICILSQEKNLVIEIKYSKYWKKSRPEYRWQFQSINPTKFDFLVLVAEVQDKHRFFVFTKEEAMNYIPPFDWAWRPKNHPKYANRWVGIYETPNNWKRHMRQWKPKRPNPQNAKDRYMSSKHKHIGYIATHLSEFEDNWNKISQVVGTPRRT